MFVCVVYKQGFAKLCVSRCNAVNNFCGITAQKDGDRRKRATTSDQWYIRQCETKDLELRQITRG